MNSNFFNIIESAVEAKKLLPEAAHHIRQLLERSQSPLVSESIQELVTLAAWEELNDRFFKTLAFGTGGLRGRSIGKIVTAAESGTRTALDRPQFPCVGTNALNNFNISRATQGLSQYVLEYHRTHAAPGSKRPSLVIAHDTRHFSEDFSRLAAQVASQLGLDVYLFEGPRSTPELSFAVRYLQASAGVVITASHNPPHDNGYKVYFSDGAQVVEPHASGIIEKVNAVISDEFPSVTQENLGTIHVLDHEIDQTYMDRLESLLIDPEMVREQNSLSVIFTSIHGTGGIITIPMFKRLGISCQTVQLQDAHDGRFPSVQSPNPENAEALSLAMKLADEVSADLVIGTDPDADRMGVAYRASSGKLELLTGNQIAALIGYYRIHKLSEAGVIHENNRQNATFIKTFVTTDLLEAIANAYGIRCVNTLTGFKYIGQKLRKYESLVPLPKNKKYTELTDQESRELRLKHSTFYVFGGEESYGYSGADFVRDKDANASAVMFAEVAAYAKSQDIFLDQLLDQIYSRFGFYLEKNTSMTMEGAEGANQIKRLVESYAQNPPAQLLGLKVTKTVNFATESIVDSEGDTIPAEKMLMFTLEDGSRIAIRPSGTEPKIKYYFFSHQAPEPGTLLDPNALPDIKSGVQNKLDTLWVALQEDANTRIKS